MSHSLAARVAGGLAVVGGVGVVVWLSTRGADSVYDDDTALAGWADRLAHPPSSVDVPADIALPETSTGRPLRRGVPLPVDRSLKVEEAPADAGDADLYPFVPTTSDLLLTVSKRTVRFEGRDILPVPADPTGGFDAKYKHSPADTALSAGAGAPLGYARERAWALRKSLGRWQLREGLLVMADRDLPWSLLVEVLSTVVAQDFLPSLLSRRAGKVADMNVTLPIYRLDWLVNVAVFPEAFELAIPPEHAVECEGSYVQRDGTLITIARRDDGADFEALSTCARRVEKAFPHELVYRVDPSPPITVQVLVSTVDALRKDAGREAQVALGLSPWPVAPGLAP